MSKNDLLDTLDREFADLLGAIEGISEEQMTTVWYGDPSTSLRTGWCLRDILAHIAGWHREMAGALERMARGERPVPEGVDYNDADAWNARFAAARRNTAPAAMLEELKASKEAFVVAARQVPEDRFEEGRAAFRILHTTGIDHYREHAPAISEWRRREGI